jgi:hypothetical protein
VPDERNLAVDLDRALAGEDAGAEARELAALLVAAAEPARFDVSEQELERALRDARPRRRERRRLIPALGLAAVVAAAAAVAWLVRTPGADVQARAARALDATFFVVEQVRPAQPGTFPVTDVAGYIDGKTGRAHVRVSAENGLAAETVVRRDGRVERWSAASNTLSLAVSCGSLPGGCEEALDPLGLYLRTLDNGRAAVARRGDAYELTIHSRRIDQIVTVDARTYLPRRIRWLQDGRLFSTTRFVALEPQSASPGADTWSMTEHPGAHVVQYASGGRRVRVLAARAGSVGRDLLWLGPMYRGYRARIADVLLTGGRATRITYGPVVVWNYGAVVPPQVLQGRNAPAKVFAIPGGVVHASFGAVAAVAEAEFGNRNVAVVSREGDKIDTVRAIQHLRRPGSP